MLVNLCVSSMFLAIEVYVWYIGIAPWQKKITFILQEVVAKVFFFSNEYYHFLNFHTCCVLLWIVVVVEAEVYNCFAEVYSCIRMCDLQETSTEFLRFGVHWHMISVFDFYYFFWRKVADYPALVFLRYYIILFTYYIDTWNRSIPFLAKASCPCQIICN